MNAGSKESNHCKSLLLKEALLSDPFCDIVFGRLDSADYIDIFVLGNTLQSIMATCKSTKRSTNPDSAFGYRRYDDNLKGTFGKEICNVFELQLRGPA
jgi:hypothetical protein